MAVGLWARGGGWGIRERGKPLGLSLGDLFLGHAQTVWPAIACGFKTLRARHLDLRRLRIDTPDGDFVDFDWHWSADMHAPTLVLFHGLEGSSGSHYALALAKAAHRRGWSFVVPHFRGCSGEMNRAPRAYHAGDYSEINWMLAQVRLQSPTSPIYAVGVSLGGNALCCWAGEKGAAAKSLVESLAFVSAPIDLAACGDAIDEGLNRLIYGQMFLRTMKQKAELKWQQFPGLFDLEKVREAQTIRAFDDAFTALLHGFGTVEHYWQTASARQFLKGLRVPCLFVNARNDPLVPILSVEETQRAHEGADTIEFLVPIRGGHVGFDDNLFNAVCDWLASKK